MKLKSPLFVSPFIFNLYNRSQNLFPPSQSARRYPWSEMSAESLVYERFMKSIVIVVTCRGDHWTSFHSIKTQVDVLRRLNGWKKRFTIPLRHQHWCSAIRKLCWKLEICFTNKNLLFSHVAIIITLMRFICIYSMNVTAKALMTTLMMKKKGKMKNIDWTFFNTFTIKEIAIRF